MTQTLHATFDGLVLRPEEPLPLPPNTRVLITVQRVEPAGPAAGSFLRTARSLNAEGPTDLSTRLDDYLYGDRAKDDE